MDKNLLTYRKTGKFFAENVQKERVYELFEKALEVATKPQHRNNVRLLRMAFRYTDLSNNDPTEPAAQGNTTYTDSTGEIGIMKSYFDSLRNEQSCFGIAFPVDNSSDVAFTDKWYFFE